MVLTTAEEVSTLSSRVLTISSKNSLVQATPLVPSSEVSPHSKLINFLLNCPNRPHLHSLNLPKLHWTTRNCCCGSVFWPFWDQHLKIHIRDQWICGTETNECGLCGSNREAHYLKIWMVASDHALDPKPCSLAAWTHSIRIQQNGAWKGIGGVIEMLVSVLQTPKW